MRGTSLALIMCESLHLHLVKEIHNESPHVTDTGAVAPAGAVNRGSQAVMFKLTQIDPTSGMSGGAASARSGASGSAPGCGSEYAGSTVWVASRQPPTRRIRVSFDWSPPPAWT